MNSKRAKVIAGIIVGGFLIISCVGAVVTQTTRITEHKTLSYLQPCQVQFDCITIDTHRYVCDGEEGWVVVNPSDIISRKLLEQVCSKQ